jgi:hypothetical protein
VKVRHRLVCSVAIIVTAAAPAQAQQATAQTVSTRRCPVLGIRIAVTGMDTARTPRFTLDTRTTLDTTFVLNISERRWQESFLTASLEAGVGDTTTRGRWHACTGVTISMGDVTLLLRDVRGQVHYKVDLTSLSNIRRLGPSGAPPRR